MESQYTTAMNAIQPKKPVAVAPTIVRLHESVRTGQHQPWSSQNKKSAQEKRKNAPLQQPQRKHRSLGSEPECPSDQNAERDRDEDEESDDGRIVPSLGDASILESKTDDSSEADGKGEADPVDLDDLGEEGPFVVGGSERRAGFEEAEWIRKQAKQVSFGSNRTADVWRNDENGKRRTYMTSITKAIPPMGKLM
jgi:hypothetical protein